MEEWIQVDDEDGGERWHQLSDVVHDGTVESICGMLIPVDAAEYPRHEAPPQFKCQWCRDGQRRT